MSRPSRRQSRKAGRGILRAVPEACDCPACSGEEAAAAQLIDAMVGSASPIAELTNPMDAEMLGAAFMAMAGVEPDDLVPALLEEIIPRLEATSNTQALGLLLALGSVATGVQHQIAEAASVAADRLVAAGVPGPQWAAELAEPVQVGDCRRLYDHDAGMSALVASFRRAGGEHAVLVVVDESCCGAAADILFAEPDQLSAALHALRADNADLHTEAVDEAEFRWYVEDALQARAAHDDGVPAGIAPPTGDDEDAETPYPVLAMLTRVRLAAMAEARRPAGARSRERVEDEVSATSAMQMLTSLMGGPGSRRPGGPGGFGGFDGFGGLVLPPAKLPAKRKKSAGPAPIYQLKVSLRGAKPPIWRRLLVPADVGLARLHDVIQVAFGWQDSHLHVFETPYGAFGQADRELEQRSETPVTLEQVAAEAGIKIQYVYDFGDDWVHDVLVEKVLDRDPALAYPRCTGGRRAAPPDDCGGIGGYDELVKVIADPDHSDHEELVEWLGLDDAGQFDPAAFDQDGVNRALAGRRISR